MLVIRLLMAAVADDLLTVRSRRVAHAAGQIIRPATGTTAGQDFVESAVTSAANLQQT